MRLLISVAVALAGLVLVGAPTASVPPPAVKLQSKWLGPVLATPGGLALYTWDVEKQAGGGVRCTEACADAWPPLLATGRVRPRLPAIHGRFGTVVRPDGRRQVTFNGLPIYTYVNDSTGVILCDNQDGWFVVRLR